MLIGDGGNDQLLAVLKRHFLEELKEKPMKERRVGLIYLLFGRQYVGATGWCNHTREKTIREIASDRFNQHRDAANSEEGHYNPNIDEGFAEAPSQELEDLEEIMAILISHPTDPEAIWRMKLHSREQYEIDQGIYPFNIEKNTLYL